MMRRAFSRGFHAVPNPEPAKDHGRPVAVLANGARIDLLAPKNLARAVPAIAETLARITRWRGATALPYSVAQHSTILAIELRRRGDALAALYGLYHDAHEAIIGDIDRQTEAWIETESGCAGIVERLRTRIDAALYPALGLDYPMPPAIAGLLNTVHDELAAAEMRDLSQHFAPERAAMEARGVAPLRKAIRPHPWDKAEENFVKTRDALLIEAGMAR